MPGTDMNETKRKGYETARLRAIAERYRNDSPLCALIHDMRMSISDAQKEALLAIERQRRVG